MFSRSLSTKAGKKSRFLLIFSDVNASPILLEITKNLHVSNGDLQVVVIGDSDLEICKDLRNLGIPFSLVAKHSKYGFAQMLFFIFREILSFRPQTIFASGQYATILGMGSAYVARISRRIFIRHHSNFHEKYGLRLGVRIDRISNFLSTEIVAVSEVVRNILINEEGVNSAKVTLIHNGVNLKQVTRSNSRQKKKDYATEEEIRVGVVSRLTEWKGVQYSVDAFIMLHSRFPNSHLYLVGAPADSYGLISEKLKALDASAYTLSSWNPDILEFLEALDIFIHVPIGPQDEAFGLVYVEALASGTPCIFTLSGVLHELPNPETYVEMVPYENSEAIFDAAMKMLSGSSLKKDSVPQKWLEQYSLDTMGKEYMKFLIGVK